MEQEEVLRSREQTRREPSLEQCERLAVAMGLPILAEPLQPPTYRESMLNLHALIQRTIDGDEQAAATLAALKARFGRG